MLPPPPPLFFKEQNEGLCSEATTHEMLIPHLPGTRGNHRLLPRRALRTCPRLDGHELKEETVVRESAHYLEVLRFVRQQLSGRGSTSFPLAPGVVGGWMGRWLLRGGGGPRAWGTALIQ